MFDSRLRPLIDPPLNALANILHARGVTGTMVTGIGVGFAMLCFIALTLSWYLWALFFLALNRLMDGLDGPVARAGGEASDIGGYLDIVADFVFYAGFPFFFALGSPDHALAAAFLIFSFVGTGTSFLAFAILAAKRGEETAQQGQKSFYYLSGLMEGGETIVALALICLFPAWFTVVAVIFAVLCWATTFGRVRGAIARFG